MAKLSSKQRSTLPASAFAGPKRSYPLTDQNHARNALARVSGRSPALVAKVKAKVRAKFPGIKVGK